MTEVPTNKILFCLEADIETQTIAITLPEGKTELTLPNREWAEWFVEGINRCIRTVYEPQEPVGNDNNTPKEETAMNEMNPEVRTAMEEAAIAAAKAAKHYYEKVDEQITNGSMSENDTRSFHYMATAISRLMDCMGQHDTWEWVTKE